MQFIKLPTIIKNQNKFPCQWPHFNTNRDNLCSVLFNLEKVEFKVFTPNNLNIVVVVVSSIIDTRTTRHQIFHIEIGIFHLRNGREEQLWRNILKKFFSISSYFTARSRSTKLMAKGKWNLFKLKKRRKTAWKIDCVNFSIKKMWNKFSNDAHKLAINFTKGMKRFFR